MCCCVTERAKDRLLFGKRAGRLSSGHADVINVCTPEDRRSKEDAEETFASNEGEVNRSLKLHVPVWLLLYDCRFTKLL